MPFNFLGLPSELRNNIYEQLLVASVPIAPEFGTWNQYYNSNGLTPGLLGTCKAILHEAAPILYFRNHFDFSKCSSGRVASLLEQIGHNAADITRIQVKLPQYKYPDWPNRRDTIIIEDDFTKIIAAVQKHCTALSTITASLSRSTEVDFCMPCPGVNKWATMVNLRIREISSLQEIVVEVPKNEPVGEVRTDMENQGWTLVKRAYEEEEPELDNPFGPYDPSDDACVLSCSGDFDFEAFLVEQAVREGTDIELGKGQGRYNLRSKLAA